MMSLFQTVLLSFVILLVFYTSPSLQAGLSAGEECSADADCDPDKFLICRKQSTSCTKGTCSCKVAYTTVNSVCTPNVWLGQTCVANNDIILTANGECAGGKVVCKSGYTRITDFLCGNANTKRLGEACDTTTSPPDVCYLYEDNSIPQSGSCRKDYCGCTEKIWTGYTCRSRTIGDQCGSSSDCSGNSHCVSAVCQCVAGETEYQGRCYEATDYGVKALEDECDFDTKKCALELQCLICQENSGTSKYTCNQRQPYSGSSVRFADMFVVFFFGIVAVFLF